LPSIEIDFLLLWFGLGAAG